MSNHRIPKGLPILPEPGRGGQIDWSAMEAEAQGQLAANKGILDDAPASGLPSHETLRARRDGTYSPYEGKQIVDMLGEIASQKRRR